MDADYSAAGSWWLFANWNIIGGMRGPFAPFFVCLTFACAQVKPSADPLLSRIQNRVVEDLKRLPNYTCTQTIERTVLRASKKKYEPLDTLRLEIAFVGGKELVAWPGATKFDDKRIDEFVTRAGAIGSGNFALHVHNLFKTASPVVSAAVEELRDGRKTIRYDFRVPRERSAFHLSTDVKEAIVAYHGSFWVDPETLDLVRFETEADDIPKELGLSASRDAMEYGRLRIGDSDFLLPLSSELVMVDSAGNESRNHSRFTGCRQYLGESTVTFAEPSTVPEPAKQPEAVRLPAGLSFEVALRSSVDPAGVAIGDPVTATLQKAVKKGGAIVASKGAVLSGHITRFDKRDSREGRFWVVGFEFSSLEAGGIRSDFTGNLEEAGFGNGYFVPFSTDPGRPASLWSYLVNTVSGPRPGESLLFVRANRAVVVPAGLRMVWRTLEPRQ